MSNVYSVVKETLTLPFDLYPYQQTILQKLAPIQKAGYYVDMGGGKTIMAICSAAFQYAMGYIDKIVIIVPPILIKGWYKNINSIPQLNGEAMIYAGSPRQRDALNLGESLVTIVSLNIFKNDYDRFYEVFGDKTAVIVDEATSIKNTKSANHKLIYDFTLSKFVMLLTGSPISAPIDAYAYTRFTYPEAYPRKLPQFINLHAGLRDNFNKILSWKALDKMKANLMVNSVRVLKEDVLKDLPEVTYTPLFYDLNEDHYNVYKQLATQELVEFENGAEVNPQTTQALYHKLTQLITNYDFYAQDEKKVSAVYELLDGIINELGGAKLLIFATYKLTNEQLLKRLQPYGAVLVYGGNSRKENEENIDRFISDKACQILIGQPSSMGYGVDGLQAVCRDAIFIEMPPLNTFKQAVARLHRVGQKNGVHVRLATALNTLQMKQQDSLIKNDDLVNSVVRNAVELRKEIFGGT